MKQTPTIPSKWLDNENDQITYFQNSKFNFVKEPENQIPKERYFYMEDRTTIYKDYFQLNEKNLSKKRK